MVSRSESLAAHRWVRRHVGAALFGRARPYARAQGPSPGAGVLVGALLAAVVWVAPVVVDAVRTSPPTSHLPSAPAPATP